MVMGQNRLKTQPIACDQGSGPYVVVKRGSLKVLHRVPISERIRKTASLLRGSFSIALIEAPGLSTSLKRATSRYQENIVLINGLSS